MHENYLQNVVGYEKKDHSMQNAILYHFFKLSPHQGHKSPQDDVRIITLKFKSVAAIVPEL